MVDSDDNMTSVEAEIRDTIEYWVLSPHPNSREVVHVPAGESTLADPVPACESGPTSSAVESQHRGWVAKSVEVFPPGYMRICQSCLSEML